MNSWSWSQPLALLELNGHRTRVAHVRVRLRAPFVDVLGVAERPTRGMENGTFRHLANLTDSIWFAAREARRQSGLKIHKLTASLDDPGLRSVRVRGVSFQDGSDQEFAPRHIREAKARAMQALEPIDQHLVYQKESGFLIDRMDSLHNPIGICGKELTVVMHLLFSDSAHAQTLRLVCERAGYEAKRLFPSGLAGVFGILNPEEMARRTVVILAGARACHQVLFERYAIQEYKSFLVPHGYAAAEAERLADFLNKSAPTPETAVFVTGEAIESDSWGESLRQAWGNRWTLRSSLAAGTKLEMERHSVLVGLALLTTTSKRIPIRTVQWMSIFDSVKSRAQSFVEEYF
jgi:cell division protein FtsA